MKGIYSDSSGKNSHKDKKAAEYLRLRASLLLHDGFEDALLNLTSRNVNSDGIKKFDRHLDFRSPCCDIEWQEGKYVCINGGDNVIPGYWKDVSNNGSNEAR
ncbi:hypothetical protein CYMTET_3345 [Cymbomonas tetramitiformis]|uniref:Uncharacterized protein n=1 Tax=Cymbomonas tetramitiformis TaxID=36881 RepID=A0AAE0H3H3_9CHLO|nr:hypothetical protein CYMTET_3345 [Cymbomonas tetramitiformis]